MKFYYVYLLECIDKSYYVGVTNNLDKRLAEHNSGDDPRAYTFSRRPVVLKYQTEFNDVNQAIAFEKKLKGWSRAKKEALIEGRWDDLPKLSKNKQNR